MKFEFNLFQLISLIITAITALSFFFIKKLIENKLKNHFQKIIEQVKNQNLIEFEKLKANIETDTHKKVSWIDETIAAYKDITNIGYRCRNLARDITNNNSMILSNALVFEFKGLVDLFETTLFESRFFLVEPIFNILHSYKKSLTNFRIIVEYIDKGTFENTDLNLKENFEDINQQWLIIVPQLQNDIKSKAI